MSPKKANNINKEIVALFSGFSGQSNTVTIPRMYVELTGSHSTGVVLNQCVFWSNKSKKEEGWFYKTYEEWFEEIHVPERTLRRHFEKLELAGWITTKIKKVNGINVKHIFTHTDRIIESLQNKLYNNNPNQPICPVSINTGETAVQNLTHPATLADSDRPLCPVPLYTDDYIQNTKDCETTSSSFFLPKK